MNNRLPQLFISSTYYDLQQVRATVADFIEQQLGYRLLASEYRSFPVDPSVGTVENCRRRVEKDADVLILIVGGRYGVVPADSEKSVTNLEYLAARAKGIPIYAFILRDVLALLPIFAADRSVNLSPVVESSKVLQFVQELRTTDGVWTFPFELASDITATLRMQLAYEMARGLQLSASVRRAPNVITELSGDAFRIAMEKPSGWEAKLFNAVVAGDIAASADVRRAHDVGLTSGTGERVEESDAKSWVNAALAEAGRMIKDMELLAEQVINKGFSESDLAAIVHGAHEMGSVYRRALDWAARLRRAHLPNDWRPLVQEVSRALDDFLAESEDFPRRMQRDIEAALSTQTSDTAVLRLSFVFKIGNNERIQAEIDKLRRLRP